MKALSIRQPWAWAILHAGKDVENRTWRTGHRGLLAIHASLWRGLVVPKDLAFGCVVGTVRLVDCVRDSGSPWATKGLWNWVLEDPRPLPAPVPFKGRLGLFDVPTGMLAGKER